MNPVALITGASRGIGRGIAIELARLGYNLVMDDVSSLEAAQQTRKDCIDASRSRGKRISVQIIRADISQHAARKRLIEFTRRKFKRLDILVNNAGIGPRVRRDLLEATEDSFDEVLATNLKGPYFLTQLAARWMSLLRAQDPEYAPKIIIISSISAVTASVNRGEYCISKAGLSMMAKLYALRLADLGVNVYEIRPGIVETEMVRPVKEKYDEMIKNGISPIRRWGQPEDVGRVVAAIAQGLLSFSTGEVIYVDGGMHIERL
jgi:3-oxoacyl-[acyl-carrier protein] reductase